MKKIFTLLTLCCIALSSLAQGWQDNYKGVMLQGFYWDSFDDTKWTNLEAQTNDIVDFFDLVWIPQSAKPSHNPSMGYDPLYWLATTPVRSERKRNCLASSTHGRKKG